jgi:hypothetical protein
MPSGPNGPHGNLRRATAAKPKKSARAKSATSKAPAAGVVVKTKEAAN